ncbi:MAG: PKD domain-containing protein [Candidatus Cloacimonetes bacterium]|nr:PKD domain-containing protein [Candidatus Cloacimonadota bacterium]
MKNVIFLFVLIGLTICYAQDFQKPVLKPHKIEIGTHPNQMNRNRNIPEVEFVVDPVDIIVSFYDYMPGSYCSNPMQVQPEISYPYGYPAGGYYIAFHLTETSSPGSQRRVFYAYINSDGELLTRTTITYNDTREGYAGLDVDYVTGNPIATWHNVVETDNTYDCSMSYDLYHLMSGPGLWRESFIAIDNPEDSQPFTGHDDDEFIWPRVKIGPSPIEGKRRAFIMGNNYTSNSAGRTNYNILAGYTDFEVTDMEMQNELNFTHFSFPELDDLHYNNVGRSIKEMVVSGDGQVAFVGWFNQTFFMEYSQDYGETWTYYETSGRFDLENPQNQDGTYYFENEDGTPATIFAYPSGDGGHFNALFDENNEKIVAISAFGINRQENLEDGSYFPGFFYPKIFNFSIENGELVVDVIDLYIEGANPNDNQPMIPWDLDEDGVVDQYTNDGLVSFVTSMPSWSWFGDYQEAFFHESLFKLTKVDNYLVAIWQDAENIYYDEIGVPGFDEWAEKPEIAIAVSGDNGVHWSQPAFLNANPTDDNYYEELDGMIPGYVYTADDMKIISETSDTVTLEVPLFFLDDYSYGSWTQGHGAHEGGMLTFAELEVSFQFGNIFAGFNADITSGFTPLSVQFNDASFGNIVSWEWDFDNNGMIDSYLQDPTYIYSEAGNYSVSLTINDGENSDTIIRENYIQVSEPINVDFEAEPTFGLTPLEVSFTDISEGNISQWQWDFENNSTIDSYEQHPTHIYTEVGIYSVSLRAGDGNNFVTEVKNDLITVGEQLIVDFEADPITGLSPLEVQFTDLSEGGFLNLSNQFKNNLRDIDSWEWDFDNDGTIDSYEQNPTFIYTNYGNFSVSLTASDGIQTITETKIDFIEVEPILADFEANPVIGLYPLIVQFTDLSQSATNRMSSKGKNRDILSWEWDFDNDGTIDSNEQNPSYTYENNGSFTVTLIVSDGTFYDTETKNDYIIVGEPIIANFEATPLIGYIPLEVQFTDLSEGGIEYRNNNKTSTRDITNWEWDFENDGTIDSNEQNPTHIYYEEGIFSVSLNVSDGIHEIEIIQENLITVGYPLYANFEASPLSGPNPLEVQFTDLSFGGIPAGNDREITTWYWDFQNDGTIDSYEQNPTFIYSELGTYDVALIVGDGFGTDSITQLDYIEVTSSNANNGILNIHTKLISNYPNPFNPVTAIEFNIKESETGVLKIYNVKGQIIGTKRFESGYHNYIWNAEKHTSGIYFYQLQTETFSQVKKMILMK